MNKIMYFLFLICIYIYASENKENRLPIGLLCRFQEIEKVSYELIDKLKKIEEDKARKKIIKPVVKNFNAFSPLAMTEFTEGVSRYIKALKNQDNLTDNERFLQHCKIQIKSYEFQIVSIIVAIKECEQEIYDYSKQ